MIYVDDHRHEDGKFEIRGGIWFREHIGVRDRKNAIKLIGGCFLLIDLSSSIHTKDRKFRNKCSGGFGLSCKSVDTTNVTNPYISIYVSLGHATSPYNYAPVLSAYSEIPKCSQMGTTVRVTSG